MTNPPPPRQQKSEIDDLVNAFRYFNETVTTLNTSYRNLEARIAHLANELEEKDRQLYSRLRELDRVTRYLTGLLESISTGVVGIDLEGNITIFNRTAADMTGIVAETAIGKPYAEVMGGDHFENGALRTLREGPELRGVQRPLPGRGLIVDVSTTWIVDSLGEMVGVVELFDDVTTVRNMEEKFEHQKTLRALGEMAAAVAHELRNPLAGIGGFAALLKEDLTNDPAKIKLIDRIIAGVKDLDRLAGNLLFLTRQTQLQRVDFDLATLLTELVNLLESEVRGNGNQTRLILKLPEENVPLHGDRDLLKMALTNLGRNALQAVGNGGEVTFGLVWRLLSNRVDVSIADNGVGIAPEALPKLFNPFYTTRQDGTGLGLALVKKAVDLHKGEIRVESTPGSGSCFIVTLPLRLFTGVGNAPHG